MDASQTSTNQSSQTNTAVDMTTTTTMETAENSVLVQIEQKLKENPGEFNHHQELVEYYEKTAPGDVDGLRKAYENLLAEFPLMFGYWKKYADFEDSQGRTDEAKKVYERGVTAVSTSIDLWTQYCSYVMSKSSDLDEIRNLFERAVSVAGRDYLAHKLWDKYLEFENAQEEFATVSSLYRRILTTPLKQLDTYWSQFTTFAASRPVADLVVSAKEKTRLEEAANNHPDAASGRDVEAIMREILISWREETYKETSKKLQEFSHFEQAIKRYYFHVQPLATAQQDNWRSYLEHAIKEGDHDRTVRLFERCLEACALYFEFWQRYVRYLESKGDVEGALRALRRAAKVFLKRRPEPHIALAELEEQQNNIDAAQATFDELMNDVGKGHIESVLRFVGFTYRHRGADDAAALFDKYRADIDAESLPFYDVQRAHFAKIALKQPEDQIREVFDKLTKEHAASHIAWMAAVEFELSVNNTDNAVSIFERAIGMNDDDTTEGAAALPSTTDRLLFARRYQNFAILFGKSAATLRALDAKIADLEREVSSAQTAVGGTGGKKRSADEAGVTDGDAPDAKVQKSSTADAAAAAAGGSQPGTPATPAAAAAAAWYGAAGYNPQQYYQQWYGAAGSQAGANGGMSPAQQQAYAQYYTNPAASSVGGQTPPPPQQQ